jgi:hypothetical protein
MRGAGAGFIRFGCWPFDAEQVGSEASLARQGIAQQCPERFLCRPKPPLVHVNMHERAVDEVRFHRCLERSMVCEVSLSRYAGYIARLPCLAGSPNEPTIAPIKNGPERSATSGRAKVGCIHCVRTGPSSLICTPAALSAGPPLGIMLCMTLLGNGQ